MGGKNLEYGLMLGWNGKKQNGATADDVLQALSRSQAIIEFDLDGTILTANQNFLTLVGYELPEVVGRHHSLFVDPSYAASTDYLAFWENLKAGRFHAAEYKRIGKDGKELWLQATYNPIAAANGTFSKVVKVAANTTAQKLAATDAAGQIAALSRSQAIIEFALDGTILTANANFCAALGYELTEIQGRHHSLFVDADYAASPAYGTFWRGLSRGEFQAAEYLRLGKGGRRVWILASYNPIFDLSGRPVKVVKYATDITPQKEAAQQICDGLRRLAAGDLSLTISTSLFGEFEDIRIAFNATMERFVEMIGELGQTSRALKTATTEILSGANDLAERTTKQAAAIEETSAAMEQLSGTVSDNARRTDQANRMAQQTSASAEATGLVVIRSTEAMERISGSAGKISNIIGLIDDIAFQTNLLALNASVEAARAGDAGKGFAVVAVEVRRLAQSAAGASAEVKALIEQSAAEVTAGSKLVAEASGKLEEMLKAVQATASVIEGIAQATREQSSAISEVTTAVRQMDEMTQHNAALVEQINAAIEQTEQRASVLDTMAEVFVLPNQAGRLSAATSSHSASRAAKPADPRARYLSAGTNALQEDWNEF